MFALTITANIIYFKMTHSHFVLLKINSEDRCGLSKNMIVYQLEYKGFSKIRIFAPGKYHVYFLLLQGRPFRFSMTFSQNSEK